MAQPVSHCNWSFTETSFFCSGLQPRKKITDFWVLSKLHHTSCLWDPILQIPCPEWNMSGLICVYWRLNRTSDKMAQPNFTLQVVLYTSKLLFLFRTSTLQLANWFLLKLLHTACSWDPIHPNPLCVEWNISGLICVHWSLNLVRLFHCYLWFYP